MGTTKRDRQKANRASRLDEAERQARRDRTRNRIITYGALAVVVAAAIGLVAYLQRGDDSSTATDAPTTTAPDPTAGDTTTTTIAADATETLAEFVPWSGTGALAAIQPDLRNGAYAEAPPMLIDESATYAATIETTAGTIELDLFADVAPLTVNNFVALARDGFYDGVAFHRVIPEFMAQGGDPAGVGTGGPGYQFADEFAADVVFDRRGLLAMANSGPATNGSQFFITFVPTPWLDGLHTIFGELTSGDDTLSALEANAGATGDAVDRILTVTIDES